MEKKMLTSNPQNNSEEKKKEQLDSRRKIEPGKKLLND
mgnify:CR=1 FL=1